MGKLANRHSSVELQLAWAEIKGIIHTYSSPGSSSSKYGLVITDGGPRLELSLSEVEAWISGMVTGIRWGEKLDVRVV